MGQTNGSKRSQLSKRPGQDKNQSTSSSCPWVARIGPTKILPPWVGLGGGNIVTFFFSFFLSQHPPFSFPPRAPAGQGSQRWAHTLLCPRGTKEWNEEREDIKILCTDRLHQKKGGATSSSLLPPSSLFLLPLSFFLYLFTPQQSSTLLTEGLSWCSKTLCPGFLNRSATPSTVLFLSFWDFFPERRWEDVERRDSRARDRLMSPFIFGQHAILRFSLRHVFER